LSNRKAELTMRIAECLVQVGEVERAIRDLKGLIREYPQFTAARLKLGIIYYNQNNLADATEQWENILLRDPQNPEALRLLKMAQAAGITTIQL